MKFVFDPEKNARNIELRGLPFSLVERFDFDAALIVADDRRDYGETRFVALGPIGRRLHVVVYVDTDDGVRVISLRKANARERRRYGDES